jgi:hypothetical protein
MNECIALLPEYVVAFAGTGKNYMPIRAGFRAKTLSKGLLTNAKMNPWRRLQV